MIKYAFIITAIIILLGRFNHFQPTFMIAMLGTLGMTVGFTLQGTISNFTAGILLKIFKPFKKKEFISLDKVSGTVINIDIFYTILKTIDGKIAVIPNNKILLGDIINYTRAPIRRNEFFINVSYHTDTKLIIDILKKVIDKEDRVMKNQDILIGLNKLSPYSLSFVIRCWSETKDLQNVYWDLMISFKNALDKNNIQQIQNNQDQLTLIKNKKI
ncbi:MAG: mechanosensitive ion channel [Buchnera aphidicola (Periphyllus acericola)]|uniref:mechanosensitive ion channel domain-containing protein n=1 Tax=Buchnera aphidicola TaxID=9 RepID=UPI0030D2EB9B|nr:mechanosensitive ion channel [Buchnera aphidicola (Periphyllus acericola)]